MNARLINVALLVLLRHWEVFQGREGVCVCVCVCVFHTYRKREREIVFWRDVHACVCDSERE